MQKIWLVLKREYRTRVRRKTFILTTLLTPFLFGLFLLVPWLMSTVSETTQHIVVKDESGLFKDKLQETESLKFKYSQESLELLKEQYKKKGYAGVIYIPDIDIYSPEGIQYISAKQPGLAQQQHIKEAISQVIKDKKIEKLNLSETVINNLAVDLSLQTKVLGEGGKERNANAAISTVLGYVVGFLLYIVLLIYGSIVMRSVIEEKTNRIVEIIISTVKPFQLMMGKIGGVALVGLTQFIGWFVIIFLIQIIAGLVYSDQLAQIQEQMAALQGQAPASAPAVGEVPRILAGLQNLDFGLVIFSFLFYFMGGYLLYAALFAAVGSAANDEGDVQSLSFPITIPVLLSFFIMMVAIQNPHGKLAFWSSIIPFSSPLVMPARVPFGVPLWELLLSMVLLVIGFVGTTWVAARVYRTGILMYGKKASLKEITKWFFR